MRAVNLKLSPGNPRFEPMCADYDLFLLSTMAVPAGARRDLSCPLLITSLTWLATMPLKTRLLVLRLIPKTQSSSYALYQAADIYSQ